MGNLRSVAKALEHVAPRSEVEVTSELDRETRVRVLLPIVVTP